MDAETLLAKDWQALLGVTARSCCWVEIAGSRDTPACSSSDRPLGFGSMDPARQRNAAPILSERHLGNTEQVVSSTRGG